MAVDLLCCTCAGFGFLHTFGGLFLFYIFTATFNTNYNFKDNVLDCWNGNTEEELKEEPKNRIVYFI